MDTSGDADLARRLQMEEQYQTFGTGAPQVRRLIQRNADATPMPRLRLSCHATAPRRLVDQVPGQQIEGGAYVLRSYVP